VGTRKGGRSKRKSRMRIRKRTKIRGKSGIKIR
jgi:hypothetical protein